MPYAIYDKLSLGKLKKIGLVIQLVDMSVHMSNAYVDRCLVEVLVQINEVVFLY